MYESRMADIPKSKSRWNEEQANEWFERTGGFHLGANYIPSTASNQFEMWTDPVDWATIKKELGWAQTLGYDALRIYLHDQLYTHEEDYFLRKVDKFLEIAQSYGIRIILTLLDSSWDPLPRYGPQLAPLPGVHNSRWVQSPGKELLQASSSQQKKVLHPYIETVLSKYGNSTESVLAIDLWNRPMEMNLESYGSQDFRIQSAQEAFGEELSPDTKREAVMKLLPRVWKWARRVGPLQVPLTVGMDPALQAFNQSSDVISFSSYDNYDSVLQTLQDYQSFGRPIICTGYLSRDTNSTINPILGLLYDHGVSAFHDGFVEGKTQLRYPLDSWQRPYRFHEPLHWHQDVLHGNSTPYSRTEIQYMLTFQRITDDDITQISKNQEERALLQDLVKGMVVILVILNLMFCMKRCRSKKPPRNVRMLDDVDFDDIATPPFTAVEMDLWKSQASSCDNSDDSWLIEHVIRQHRKKQSNDRAALL